MIILQPTEERPFYCQMSVSSGTLTVTKARYQIAKKADGSIVTAWTDVVQSVTGGWTVGTAATVLGWYVFKATNLTPGETYLLSVDLWTTASDNITRHSTEEFEIYIRPPGSPYGVATYDLSTNVGKVRLYANDRDVEDARWKDGEIQQFLTEADDNIFLAAALSLESDLRLIALGSGKVRLGVFGTDDSDVPANIQRTINSLRSMAAPPPVLATNVPDPIFTPASMNGETETGTLNRW